jgi:T-complex protein 1 subunit eta
LLIPRFFSYCPTAWRHQLEGVAFNKTFSYAGFEQQPKKFLDPKILLLHIELELIFEKENAEIRYVNPIKTPATQYCDLCLYFYSTFLFPSFLTVVFFCPLGLSDPLQYQSIVDAEWNIIYDKLDKCIKSGAKIVLSWLATGDLATQVCTPLQNIILPFCLHSLSLNSFSIAL